MFNKRNLLVIIALAMPACVVSGRGSLAVDATTPVVYQEPPAPQVETVTVNPGHVWVKGRWDWRGGQWVWMAGHWEAERVGFAWNEGRWDRRGNQWVWDAGPWGS